MSAVCRRFVRVVSLANHFQNNAEPNREHYLLAVQQTTSMFWCNSLFRRRQEKVRFPLCSSRATRLVSPASCLALRLSMIAAGVWQIGRIRRRSSFRRRWNLAVRDSSHRSCRIAENQRHHHHRYRNRRLNLQPKRRLRFPCGIQGGIVHRRVTSSPRVSSVSETFLVEYWIWKDEEPLSKDCFVSLRRVLLRVVLIYLMVPFYPPSNNQKSIVNHCNTHAVFLSRSVDVLEENLIAMT